MYERTSSDRLVSVRSRVRHLICPIVLRLAAAKRENLRS